MDMMSIAAMSVGLHQSQAMQDMGVSVLKMAMEDSAGSVEDLLGEMTESLDPNLGANIDILA